MSGENLRELLQQEVQAALKTLLNAANELTQQLPVPVPMPRPRIFYLTPSVQWPYVSTQDNYIHWNDLSRNGTSYWLKNSDLAQYICSDVMWRPRAVLRVIRRIEAAATWCRRRAEGRRRAAEEILQQQRDALKKLQARTALRELAGEET